MANHIDVPEHCWMGSRLGWGLGFDGRGHPEPTLPIDLPVSVKGNWGGNEMTPSKAEQGGRSRNVI